MSHRSAYWNRKLLNYLWVAVLVSFMVPIINYPFTDLSFREFFIYRMFIPLGFELMIMSILEVLNKKNYPFNDYMMILGSAGITLILNVAHVSVIHVLLPLFYLPIFIAIFTIESKKILFAYGLSALCFLGLNIFHSAINYDLVESTTLFFILSSAGYLSYELTKRYKDIYDHLQVSISNQQELLYKNILMEKLSKMDLATNLYNHKTFHNYLDELFIQHQRQAFELHLALLDLDDFKQVNDAYGHSVGDQVIKKIADIILENMGPHAFAARYGGEEFAIIFTENKKDRCYEILEGIRKSLENQHFENIELGVTVSIGFASAEDYSCKEDLFKNTDNFLYLAKEMGKNQIVTK